MQTNSGLGLLTLPSFVNTGDGELPWKKSVTNHLTPFVTFKYV